mmetsp:Transcript_6888/g.6085  ORF Transcript_6888/g.6085 Transcript_6888/m.6085 type:complete len:104 (-) Transcript_6888:363-674(-)
MQQVYPDLNASFYRNLHEQRTLTKTPKLYANANDEVIQEIHNIERFNAEKQLILLNTYFQKKPQALLKIEKNTVPISNLIEEAQLYQSKVERKAKTLQKYVHR